MKYIVDHDFHIHSQLSRCSKDPKQTPERILEYAKQYGFKKICVTDHFWDSNVKGASDWYEGQNFQHVSSSLPLPQSEGIDFKFGCETDVDMYMTLGVSEENMDKFDFIIIPTTHLHMDGFTIREEDKTLERRAELYVKRLQALLGFKLPNKKIGIAHLTCPLLAPANRGDHLAVIEMISDDVFKELFKAVAEKGYGVELNMPIEKYTEAECDVVLRPYRIAKECGCKFYLGSDAHHPNAFEEAVRGFKKIVDLLDLKESDKFLPFD